MTCVPCKVVNGIILMHVTANEQEGYFAFDTGAMQTAVNKAYFPELRGDRVDIAKFSEQVCETTAKQGYLDSLRFSDVERTNLPVLVMDLMYVENVLRTAFPDIKLLGTLGIDVIADYSILLDYDAPEIILDPQLEFEKQMLIPMCFHKLPVIKVAVGKRVCQFVLDTGANTCLLGQSFFDDPNLTPISGTKGVVNIPVVRIIDSEYTNISAVVSDMSAIQKILPVDGVIGYQILLGQRSIWDFKNKQIRFEKGFQDEH